MWSIEGGEVSAWCNCQQRKGAIIRIVSNDHDTDVIVHLSTNGLSKLDVLSIHKDFQSLGQEFLD